ncbi:MAG: tripartite tricarboxylate transporter TctB family protein [Chloroflexi bacterium]|nr:tripartite tricarboxylate transporter TctB family protein [Chloroflexota bacterium]
MRLLKSLAFEISALLVFAFVIISAQAWPVRARWFPSFVAGAGVLFTFAQILFVLRRRARPGKEAPELAAERPATFRQAFRLYCWIFALFLGIWVGSFPISLFLFVFLYLMFWGREKWLFCLVYSGALSLFIWIIFDYIVHIPWPDSLIQRWLM